MEVADTVQLKSPIRKLVSFFRRSRDQWKSKYVSKRNDSILLANKVRALEKSRQNWREIAQLARLETKKAKEELRDLRVELKKSNA